MIYDFFTQFESFAVYLVDQITGTDLDSAALLAECRITGYTCSTDNATTTSVPLANLVEPVTLIRDDPLLNATAQADA